MIINAIKFRTPDENAPKVWRFGRSDKELQNFQCFYGTPQELKNFRNAVIFALTGDNGPNITEATIQISRGDSSDTWIIERNSHQVRMIKNGTVMEQTDVSSTMLGAFLDLDEGMSVSAFDTFNLKYDNQQMTSVPVKEDHPGPRRVAELVESNRSQLRRQIAAVFQQPLLEDDRVIRTLMKSARNLWESYREQMRQKRTLLAKTGTSRAPDQSELNRIEREVELMRSIDKILQPLVDPTKAPKVVKEKLTKIEDELTSLLRECQLRELPSSAQTNLPWEKLLGTLTRLITYQNLVEASDKILDLIENKCQKIGNRYIETLESLIDSDNHIIAELESCLSTLSIQFEDIAEPKSSGFGDLVSKFIKPPQQGDAENRKGRLENARMAIDYVLARLGELHGSIQTTKEESEATVDKIRERHEAFVQEHGKLSKLWHQHALEMNLPESMTIKQLLKLISSYGRMMTLKDERARLRELLQNRRTDLQSLEAAVTEWRRAAQSQKDTPLDNVSLLVSEAQGVVRYLPKKEEALEKQKQHLETQRSYLAIKHNIESSIEQTEHKWVKLFNELQVPAVDIGRTEWGEVFQLGQQFLGWDTIRNQSRKPVAGEEIFSDSASDAPVGFYSCLAVETSNAQRLTLLQTIENHSTTNLQILMTSDANLQDMLAKIGVTSGRAVAPEELRRKAPEPSVSRAQQILDLLNQKQT